MKQVSLFVATLIVPVLAWTQFDRIDVEEIDNGGAVSAQTYRIYAVMQSEGDVIDAVFGEEGNYSCYKHDVVIKSEPFLRFIVTPGNESRRGLPFMTH